MGGGEGWAMLGGRRWGAGKGGTYRCDANVGNVPEKLQNARGENCGQRKSGSGQRWGRVWEKNPFCGQKAKFVGKKKCIITRKLAVETCPVTGNRFSCIHDLLCPICP